jgi:hypothetical protein
MVAGHGNELIGAADGQAQAGQIGIAARLEHRDEGLRILNSDASVSTVMLFALRAAASSAPTRSACQGSMSSS